MKKVEDINGTILEHVSHEDISSNNALLDGYNN